jgi:hypothetical protein
MSPVAYVAKLVPPLVAANVPATVTTPDVAVDGVKPVDPKEIVDTGLAAEDWASSVTALEEFLK